MCQSAAVPVHKAQFRENFGASGISCKPAFQPGLRILYAAYRRKEKEAAFNCLSKGQMVVWGVMSGCSRSWPYTIERTTILCRGCVGLKVFLAILEVEEGIGQGTIACICDIHNAPEFIRVCAKAFWSCDNLLKCSNPQHTSFCA